MPGFIYQLPARVLDELCRSMDTLSEWDWMQFGRQVPGPSSPLPAFPGAVTPGPVAAALRSTEEDRDSREPWGPSIFQSPGSALPRAHQPASLLLPSIEDTAPSIKTDLPSMLDSKDFSTSISKQERLLSCSGNSLLWSEADVVQATSDFGPSHRIIRGTFADVYRGQRHGVLLVIKKLQEGACSSPESLERYLQAEVRVCLRCCHPNVLPLLGFCTGGQFHSLIYPYMANGSLQDRLQGQGGSDPLPWPQLVSICSGLLHAVEHLHILDIIHGNIKSSNVLLDEEFTPKLAHPVAQLYPVHKRSEYTVMKTHLFQASAAYMPEDFIRVGQLTKRVDVFSCGIVLAEVLTGMPAMDNGRSPVYLKDLLLSEITSSRKTGVEKVLAKEICQKYLEKRAWSLPEHCAEALATAVCLCLQRRNTGLQEALGSVAAVEEWLRGRGPLLPWSGLSAGTCSSANTPEESDVVDHAGLDAASSGRAVRGAAAEAEAGGLQADSSGAQSETSWKIEINEAKRKLMENILLYKEEKLDSIELFGP